MFLIFVKDNDKHTLTGVAEDVTEVKSIIHRGNLKDKIENGKAYLVEGKLKLIRPETTPELFDTKGPSGKSDSYY
ncbi:MAG: hypothetical protein ACOC7U_07325 [Spirochaetota bacterium]